MYVLLAAVLVPWIFNIAETLPTRHLVRHWDAMWVGFDALLFVSLALTIWLALKNKVWVVLAATAMACLYVVDAWFDFMTARPGKDQRNSAIFGVLEIGLAVLTFRIVIHLVKRSTRNQGNIKLISRKNSKF